jgi:4-aminobutyrate aminotransferase-like enzyme
MTISTFGGNPLSCAAAHATLEVIESDDLVKNADVQGQRLRDGLEELKRRHPVVIGDVRGKGLMLGLELVKDRQTKEPAPEATSQLLERTREHGLLVGKGGLYANVIRLSPMLNIGKPDVDEAVRILDKSFGEVHL